MDSGSEKKKEGGWERKQLRIELKDEEGSSQLDEKCTGSKKLRTNNQKTNCVILKKVWKGRGVIQKAYVKIPHQGDEGAEE